MPDPNPFEDVERAVAAAIEKQLAIALELDGMETDVTSWEASFLQSILTQLREKRPLSQRQLDILNRMAADYDIDAGDV